MEEAGSSNLPEPIHLYGFLRLFVTPEAEQSVHLPRRPVDHYLIKCSKRQITFHQHIALFCLKVRKDTTYRMPLDERIEIPQIWSTIDLELLLTPSSLCHWWKRFRELAIMLLRARLRPITQIGGYRVPHYHVTSGITQNLFRTVCCIQDEYLARDF